MKVLILTCNTGQGHNSSAMAIRQEFLYKNTDCEIVDALSFFSKTISKIVEKSFTSIYRHVPKGFDKGYQQVNGKNGNRWGKLTNIILKPASRKLKKFIDSNEYTYIICTHIFPAIMITDIAKKYGMSVPTALLTTDYTVYPLMEQVKSDFYLIPHEKLVDSFEEFGIPKEQLFPSGIPVRSTFTHFDVTREEARDKLNLPKDAKVVLIMGGSMGCGPLYNLVCSVAQTADDSTYLLVSCGSNESLYQKINKIASDRVRHFRYSDDIPTMMKAADLFVTKPGGISITESAIMCLPMLLINFIGGCETPNYNFFVSNEFAFGADRIEDAQDVVKDLLSHPEKLRKISENLKESFTKNSALEIVGLVMSRENATT